MTALQATDFDGLLSLEIFNDQFRAGSARSVAIDGRRSLLYLFDQLRERGGTCPPGLVQLPPRAKCHGTEFIEFAIDENEAPAFEALLRGLGFMRAGVHKSKAVTRWTQGAINIVVNAEKEGFAHSFNITHGTGVCAIGLAVDDAAATLARAEGLLDKPFRQAVGPGELEIPAVRGLGGSLVYFVDKASDLGRVWEIEFTPTGETGRRRRPAHGRPHLPVHALRGDAHLGAVLYLAARPQEDRRAGRARSRRARQKPGGAVGGRRTAHRAQRLAVGAHAVVALPHRGVRLGRAAHRASPPPISPRPLRGSRRTASTCCRSRRTTTTISKPRPTSRWSGSRPCALTTFSTTATAAPNTCRSTPARSGSVSSSRSWSGAAMPGSAPPMPRSGSRRRRGSRGGGWRRSSCERRDRAVTGARPKNFIRIRAIAVGKRLSSRRSVPGLSSSLHLRRSACSQEQGVPGCAWAFSG